MRLSKLSLSLSLVPVKSNLNRTPKPVIVLALNRIEPIYLMRELFKDGTVFIVLGFENYRDFSAYHFYGYYYTIECGVRRLFLKNSRDSFISSS